MPLRIPPQMNVRALQANAVSDDLAVQQWPKLGCDVDGLPLHNCGVVQMSRPRANPQPGIPRDRLIPLNHKRLTRKIADDRLHFAPISVRIHHGREHKRRSNHQQHDPAENNRCPLGYSHCFRRIPHPIPQPILATLTADVGKCWGLGDDDLLRGDAA